MGHDPVQSGQHIGFQTSYVGCEHLYAVERRGRRDTDDADRVVLRGDQPGDMGSMPAVILAARAG
jgi:hypothetical protein